MKRQRQAKRMILWGLAGFLVLQLSLALVLGWGPWPFLRDPCYGYKAYLLRGRLASPRPPLTVVVLGSSRTLHGLDGGALDGPLSETVGCRVVVFNMAQEGAGPAMQLLFLRRLLRDGIKPDLLLSEIQPLFLAKDPPLQDFGAAQLPACRLWSEDVPLVKRHVHGLRPGLRRQWGETWLLPWYGHRLALLGYLAPALLPNTARSLTFAHLDLSGFAVPLQPRLELSSEERKTILELTHRCYRECLETYEPGGDPGRALRELLETCRQEGIRTALLISPEGPIFRGWYPPGSDEQLQSFLRSLTADREVPIINAREWLREEDFRDSHHLLPQAVPAYTHRLGQEGILPLLLAALANPTSDIRHPK